MQLTQVGDYVTLDGKAPDEAIAEARDICRQQATLLGAFNVDISVKLDFPMVYYEGSIRHERIVDIVSWEGYINAKNSGEIK